MTGNTVAERDAVVIGAGISGIYQLHRLAEAGLDVELVEAGSGIGGTWYWNRYPGARFDIESYTFGYLFSPELFRGWQWSEHFAGQAEMERYLNWAVDVLGLSNRISLGHRVESLVFDSALDLWEVGIEGGRRIRTRFVIGALGLLSHPQYPDIEGREAFQGESFHTSRWPHEPITLQGKKVAVIGTGSSGVQVIQTIAAEVDALYVFQRTPQWATPLNNSLITPTDQQALQEDYEGLRDRIARSSFGSVHEPVPADTASATDGQRHELYETLWRRGGFAKVWGNYRDLVESAEANAEFSSFVADKIRARLIEPALAERLIPTDHGYAVRRPPFETDYFEVYNRSGVHLIDLRDNPIRAITSTGIQTSQAHYDVDTIVYATGYDVATGPYTAIDIQAGDTTIRDAWADGPQTYLSVQTPGFPNLFLVGGPHTITVNFPRGTEAQADLITAIIDHARVSGYTRVEPTVAAAAEWSQRAADSVRGTLLEVGKDWVFGTNTPGKKRTYLQHAISLPSFRKVAEQVTGDGFPGFEFR
jgi:cation diffusion facilitator CzcD-associated flavoprotein CzcO